MQTKLNLPNTECAPSLDRMSNYSRNINSTLPDASTADKAQTIEAEYAQYTHAPPPYTEKQYEGKSEDEQNAMRTKDYAKEISRVMGHQLVKDLKSGKGEYE